MREQKITLRAAHNLSSALVLLRAAHLGSSRSVLSSPVAAEPQTTIAPEVESAALVAPASLSPVAPAPSIVSPAAPAAAPIAPAATSAPVQSVASQPKVVEPSSGDEAKATPEVAAAAVVETEPERHAASVSESAVGNSVATKVPLKPIEPHANVLEAAAATAGSARKVEIEVITPQKDNGIKVIQGRGPIAKPQSQIAPAPKAPAAATTSTASPHVRSSSASALISAASASAQSASSPAAAAEKPRKGKRKSVDPRRTVSPNTIDTIPAQMSKLLSEDAVIGAPSTSLIRTGGALGLQSLEIASAPVAITPATELKDQTPAPLPREESSSSSKTTVSSKATKSPKAKAATSDDASSSAPSVSAKPSPEVSADEAESVAEVETAPAVSLGDTELVGAPLPDPLEVGDLDLSAVSASSLIANSGALEFGKDSGGILDLSADTAPTPESSGVALAPAESETGVALDGVISAGDLKLTPVLAAEKEDEDAAAPDTPHAIPEGEESVESAVTPDAEGHLVAAASESDTALSFSAGDETESSVLESVEPQGVMLGAASESSFATESGSLELGSSVVGAAAELVPLSSSGALELSPATAEQVEASSASLLAPADSGGLEITQLSATAEVKAATASSEDTSANAATEAEPDDIATAEIAEAAESSESASDEVEADEAAAVDSAAADGADAATLAAFGFGADAWEQSPVVGADSSSDFYMDESLGMNGIDLSRLSSPLQGQSNGALGAGAGELSLGTLVLTPVSESKEE